jgi:tRNA 2-(methylsulfanyl)-N6-isopentenyladenosine37 hydroxylase
MAHDDRTPAAPWSVIVPTSAGWLEVVRSDLEGFLADHAACERKASAHAMTLASHYRDKEKLVSAMVDLACEELGHFRRVYERIVARGGRLGPDSKDPYIGRMGGLVRRGPDVYLLDRLLIAGVVEARGAERFRILADGLVGHRDASLCDFYADFARSEERHAELFIGLAKVYFPEDVVETRTRELFQAEAEVIASLPLRPALH